MTRPRRSQPDVAGWLCSMGVLLLAAAAVGCAARRPTSLADRFIRQGDPTVDLGGPTPSTPTAEYVSQLRALAAQARPREKATQIESLEARDPRLKAALAALSAAPSAAAHREVALEYRRLGIPDAAFTHVSAAIRIDPKDAAAHDLRAKLWRAWGLSSLGLADARRAVQLAPRSATAWNTLGLLLEGSGSGRLAIRAYVRAVQFDAQAGYAWNNLCRTWAAVGENAAAVQACRRTLALEPGYADAQLMLYQAERHLEPPTAAPTGERARAERRHGPLAPPEPRP